MYASDVPFSPQRVHVRASAWAGTHAFACYCVCTVSRKSALKLITIMDVGVHVYVPFCVVCVCVKQPVCVMFNDLFDGLV